MMTEDQNIRAANVLKYVAGVLGGMIQDGMASGGKWKLTPEGRADFERLQSQGFQLSAYEVDFALATMQAPEEVDPRLALLVKHFCGIEIKPI